MSSQSEKIAALVASLKNGEITKEELFARLQSLQQQKQQNAAPASASPAPGPRGNEPVSPSASVNTAPAAAAGAAAQADGFASAIAATQPAPAAAAARSPAAMQDAYASYLQSAQQAALAATHEMAGGRRPSTAGSTGRRGSVSSVRSEGGEPRGRRDRDLGASASQYGAEDTECTFQPRTTQLPAHYGSNAQYVLQSIPFRGEFHHQPPPASHVAPSAAC